MPIYRSVLAGELVAAIRCLRARNLTPKPLAGWLAECAVLDPAMADRDLTADLLKAEDLLA